MEYLTLSDTIELRLYPKELKTRLSFVSDTVPIKYRRES